MTGAKKFSRLLRALAQKDTKVVVSLGGGGVRMFAHVAFFEFLESVGAQKHIAEVWGTSGGAIIGMLYSMGISPAELKETALKIYRQQHPIPRIPSTLRMGFKVVKDFFMPMNGRRGMRRFHDFQIALHKIVAKSLKKNDLQYPFYCTAFNLESSETDILTPLPIPPALRSDGMYQLPPLEAVAASSAVPVVFVPKVIEDSRGKRVYVDGALVEEVPTASVYKKWLKDRELGLEKKRRLLVVTVNLHPPFASMGMLDHWILRHLPGYEYLLLSLNCADFMKQARTQAQKKILMEDPKVELWDINLDMSTRGMMNLDLIPQIFEVAERSFPQQFEKINDSLLG